VATLVSHAGALGDLITTLPAMGVWRRLHAGEPLVLLGRPGLAECADSLFDDVGDIEGADLAPLFSSAFTPTDALSRRFSIFSSALLFSVSASPLTGNLAALGVGGIVRQDPFPKEAMHVVDYHLSLFEPCVVTAEDRMPRVRVSREAGMPAAGARVAIHPGSGSPWKNWPLDRFIRLARLFVENGDEVAWIVGPAERGGEADRAAPPGALVWRDLPLPRLAGLLAGCVLFVGNDSGVTHLAAAAGCSTVALFGASDPRVWAPRGRDVIVIVSSGDGVDRIEVGEVFGVCRKERERSKA
jgi:hypothetical protein